MAATASRLTPGQQDTIGQARTFAAALGAGSDEALAAHLDRPLGYGAPWHALNVYAAAVGRATELIPRLLDIIDSLAGDPR